MASHKSIHEALDNLVNKLENLQAEKSSQIEDAGKLSANLDRLAELIANLEVQSSRENKLVQKFEVIINQLDRLVKEPLVRSESERGDLEFTLRKIIAGTRTVGQVIEIIANSIQLMFDSIIKTFNDFKVTTASQGTRSSNSSSLDLARVLEPMNTLLRTLVNNMEKKSDPEIKVNTDETRDVSSDNRT